MQTSTQHTSLNADAGELSRFSAWAHRWWDLQGEFRALHAINPLRLNWIDEYAGITGKKILDVGCGGGILSEAMALRGAQVTGIDLAEKSLKIARLHSLDKALTIDYQLMSAENMAAEKPAYFDAVTCMEMLEHVPDPASVVSACAQLCKPGGWVFFSTLNRNAKSFLQAIIGAEYLLGLLPKGTHHYEKFIKPSELATYCRAAHLNILNMTGLTYHPLKRVYSLINNTDVNYMIACQKIAL